MRSKAVIVLCLLSAVIYGWALASEQGELNPEIITECIGMQHGPMMRCIQKGMNTLVEETKKLPLAEDTSSAAKKEASDDTHPETNPVAADEYSLAQGKAFYGFNCLSCHGASGQGDGSMAEYFGKRIPDLTHSDLQALSDGELLWKVTEGGWPMPAFGYQKEWSRAELWNVINYIRTFSKAEEN